MIYQGQLCGEGSSQDASRYDPDGREPHSGETSRVAGPASESAFRSISPGPDHILAAVSLESGISIELLLSPRRERRIAQPRQLTMYLIRRLCLDFSFARIGAFIGGRDHKTVMHACDLIEYLLTRDAELRSLERRVHDRLYDDPW